MSILNYWHTVLDGSGRSRASASENAASNDSNAIPGVAGIMLGYVIPLSLVTPIMLSIVVRQYPQLFTDLLPGDRLNIVVFALFVLQVVAVPLMALIVKHLSEMVGVIPSFKEALLVMAVSATPCWLVALFYLVPSFAFNIVMHAVSALLASILVYLGVRNVFGLQRRGARIMLTTAIVATASLAFGVLLVSTLMFWGHVQQLQFAVPATH